MLGTELTLILTERPIAPEYQSVADICNAEHAAITVTFSDCARRAVRFFSGSFVMLRSIVQME